MTRQLLSWVRSPLPARFARAIGAAVALCSSIAITQPVGAQVVDPYTGPDLVIQSTGTSTNVVMAMEAQGPVEVNIRSLNAQLFPFVFLDVDAADSTGSCALFEASNFTVREDGIQQLEYFSVTPPNENQGVRLVDVVFIMDNSGSMGDDQAAVRNNVYGFIDQLTQAGINYAFGVTRYGQAAASGNPIIEDNGNLTADAAYFKDSLWTRNVINGAREPGYLAIVESAAKFSFRPGSRRVFIIITDESPNQGGATVDDASAALQGGDVTLFAVTATGLFSTFQALVDEPTTQLVDLRTSFDQIFAAISSLLADTYRVSYKAQNEALDGLERIVEVQVSCEQDVASDITSYVPGSAPRISRTPETVALGDVTQPNQTAITIQARVIDQVEPFVLPGGVRLYYRSTSLNTNAPYSWLEMTHIGEDIYSAEVSAAQVSDPGIDYYISATDGVSTSTEPASDAATEPYTIAVFPNEPPLLLHIPVTSAAIGIPVVVCAEASDATTSLAGIALNFRKKGALVYESVAMVPATSGPCPQGASPNNFEATIPGEQVTLGGVEYFIDAFDDFNVHTTSGTAGQPNAIEVYNAPRIAALSAYEGNPGSAINISGTGFGPIQGNGSVLVCGLSATVLYWTSQDIGIEIPFGIPAGNACDLLLTNDAGTSSETETFLVTDTVTIFGSIREADGKPVQGAVVELANAIGFALVRTGSNGSYRATGLPSGTYTVTPSLSGYIFGPPSTWINVSSGTTNSVSFVATPSAPTLRNVSPDHGLPDATVTLTGRGFGSYDETSSRVEFETSDGVLIASVVSWAADSIEVVAPVATGGAMVSVVTPLGISNTLGFQYRAPPKDVFVLVGGDFNPLDYSRFKLVRANAETATYEITIRNASRIWYYVKPQVVGDVTGSGSLAQPFLIGPSAEKTLGEVTFSRKSYLSFFADATVDYDSCKSQCDVKTWLITFVTGLELGFRVVFGTPIPADQLEGFDAGIKLGSPVYALGRNIYEIMTGNALQKSLAFAEAFDNLKEFPNDPILKTLTPGLNWTKAFSWAGWVGSAAYSLEYVTAALDPAVPKFGALNFSAK